MSHKAIIHSILLIFAVIMVFFWVLQPRLSYYNLQATALLMLLLVFSRYFTHQEDFRLVESIISTMAVLLVIKDTGSLTSPLFFLNFFLLFELSLLLEPIIPLILSGALIGFYFSIAPGQSLSSYSILLSFPFMTPLSIFLGQIYNKEENQKKEISILTKKIQTLKTK